MPATQIYHAAGQCEATFDAATQTIYARWDKFPAEGHFRPCLDAQAKLVAAGRAKFVIVDVSKTTGVPLQEDQAYLVEKVFPAYKAGGLKAIITVVPASAITKMGAKRWQDSGSQFGFAMYEAASVADAEQLIRDKASKAA
jgi:hypothetical protein